MGRITGLCDGLPSSPEAVCQVARKEDYQRVLLNVINELRKHWSEWLFFRKWAGQRPVNPRGLRELLFDARLKCRRRDEPRLRSAVAVAAARVSASIGGPGCGGTHE